MKFSKEFSSALRALVLANTRMGNAQCSVECERERYRDSLKDLKPGKSPDALLASSNMHIALGNLEKALHNRKNAHEAYQQALSVFVSWLPISMEPLKQ